MKKIVPLLLFFFTPSLLKAQNFTGQWKGEFIDKSTSFTGWGGDRCDYVLELECSGNKVSGYSYTYFSDGGKKYYTICKLSGTINKASKSIEVKETERTKTNVPITIRNCFQIHRLTYFQKGDELSLEGSWVPVPNQEGDCGYGTTALSRRLLQKNTAFINKPVTKSAPVVKNKPVQTTPPPVAKNTPKQNIPPVVKTPAKKTPPVVKKETKKITQPPLVKAEPVKKETTPVKDPVTNNLPTPPVIKTEPVIKPLDIIYTKRSSELLKTIEIDNPTFTVSLYDNGEIDGDSISLLFNGNLILSHKRLSDKALTLKLEVDKNKELNELVMYAENLGSIPPNTALMLVNDGDNRYEVRISSDLQKSGVIRFKYRDKIKQ
ncbi:MAG: hypothetical protein JNM14_00130 [Ferruginibacter sp.]|nr:hypothetical protein [Ferruginibacter sp.]